MRKDKAKSSMVTNSPIPEIAFDCMKAAYDAGINVGKTKPAPLGNCLDFSPSSSSTAPKPTRAANPKK